jgi:hypothetical protein
VISCGQLGAVGEYQEIKDKSLEETKQTYNLLTLAVSTITSALQGKQINKPYIIAVEDDKPSDGIAPHGARVLYPENYKGNLLF